ncbi:MAG TPA: TonB-dependent receptor, partial [Bryobacteraceae bacterium]|nr:TonB-dependent receptor [Bryobacteraceae bacterium]
IFARFDHKLSASQQLTARWSSYDLASPNARSVGGLNAESRGTRLDDHDRTIALTEVATLTPRTLSELRFQFTRSRLDAPGNDLTGPAVSIAGVANFGASTSSPTGRDNDLYELGETLSFERGAHLFKAGVDFLYNRLNIEFPGSLVAAVYSFPSLAAFQAGRYSTFQQAFGAPAQFQSNPNAGFFAQDEWKASPSLTLNLGLRYDLQLLPAPIRLDRSNVGPRLGVAWSPGSRRTVVRANYGLYYDRIPLRAVSNALQRDGTKYRVALEAYGQAGAPAFPAQLAAFPAGQYVNITTIDPHIENSYAQQAGLQAERALGRAVTLTAGYQWVRALHLLLSRNLNVPTLSAAGANAAGIPNLGRPDPRWGNVSRYEASGDSSFHGLLVSLRAHPGRGLELRAAYTLSKAIDDTGNFFFSTPQSNSNLRDDRGLSDNDQRHRLSVAAVLESPARGALLGGWQLAPMFQYSSALPFNVQVNYDRNHDTNLNDRPAGVGRNTGRGFDFASLDMRLSRTFRAGEHCRVQALAESFNTLNRVNRSLPNNIIGTGTGAPLASFGRATAVYDPRQLQMGLRLDF